MNWISPVKNMKIAVITSGSCPYPSLASPQYLDQDECFRSLATKTKLLLIGNILQKREYAASLASYPEWLVRLPAFWNNRLSVSLPAVSSFRNALDNMTNNFYEHYCSKIVKTYNADILYSFPMPYERYSAKLAQKLNKPLVIEMWEDYACFSAMKLTSLGLSSAAVRREKERIYQWLREIILSASRVIVPSKILAGRLRQLGVSEDKIRIMPVPIKPNQQFVDESNIIRKKLGIKDDEMVIFHIGSASPWHDLSTLFSSTKYLKSKFFFIIAGRRDEKMEQLAARYSSSNVQVEFTGQIEASEVGAFLTLADICVAPYFFPEASGFFPGKVIRYMLAGKAIVASATPEIKEMFKDKQAGILVSQQNTQAMAAIFEELAHDGSLRRRLGETARGIALANYLPRHHTEQLISVFRELL